MHASQRYIPHVHKIAVLRANAIGDFICTLPALEALRAAYPEAEIVLLGKAWHTQFLQGRPGPVDRVIVVPPYAGVSTDEATEEDQEVLETFFAEMQREHFDLALQLHGGGKHSNAFVLDLGAQLTAGLRTPDAPALDRWIPYIYFQPEILRHLEVVSLVGAHIQQIEPHIAVTERDLQEARQVVDLHEDTAPLVVLHPGATSPRRRWPVEHFAAAGDALVAQGAHVVVTGSQDETQLTAAVVQAMQKPGQNLGGKLSLNAMLALLSRSRVVITNDSGPLHLAAAVGTSTVGIYWCFNLVNYGLPTRLHHRPLTSWRLECPICGTNCTRGNCEHQASFVADITVQEVVEMAMELYIQEEQACRDRYNLWKQTSSPLHTLA